MDRREVRLEVLRMMMPSASRLGLSDPDIMTATTENFVNYILDETNENEDTTDSSSARRRGRRRVKN